jgi:trehalose transport system substrate-binding protein
MFLISAMKTNLKAISTMAFAIVVVIIIVVAGIGVYYATTVTKTTTTTAVSTSTAVSVSTSTAVTTVTAAPVTVNFYESLAPSESAYFQTTLIPEFESANPGITVQFINLPSGQPPEEIATLVASNDVGASLFGLDNLAVGSPLYAGQLMNLTSIVSTMMPSTLIPSATKMVGYETQVFHGVYFIPFRSNIPLVFYDKQYLASKGITSAPATDAQLLADAQTLGSGSVMFQGSANTGSEGGADTGTEMYQFMVQDGGNPFVFNDTGDIQAMQFVDNLSAYFNPGFTAGYWGTYTGLATTPPEYSILDYQWPYVYTLLENATFKMTDTSLGVYAGPNGTVNGNHLLGGDVLVIPVGATNLPAIEKLANFLLSPTPQQQTLVNLSWVAVNSQAYTNLPASTSTVGAALEAAISTGVFLRNPTPWITEWNVYLSNAFTKIVVDNNGHPSSTYSSIRSTMSYYNQQFYNYLKTAYSPTVANEYEAGGFAPISV